MKTILFPGWGIPPAEYRQHFPDAEIIDYGFFGNESDSPHPLDALEQLNETVVVIGHSLGTVFAIRTAAKFPNLVRKLILYAPFVRFVAKDAVPGHPAIAVENMLHQCETVPQRMLRAFKRNLYHPAPTPADPWPSENATPLAEGLRVLLTADIAPQLPLIQGIETEIISGAQDAIVAPAMIAYFETLMPNAKPIRINNGGHMSILTSSPS